MMATKIARSAVGFVAALVVVLGLPGTALAATRAACINDAPAVTEGDAGTTNAIFTVSMCDGVSGSMTVTYTTNDSSAVAPGDYTVRTGTVTVTKNTDATVTVPIVGDTLDENNELFLVVLSNPVGGTIQSGNGLGAITDNDPFPAVSINDRVITEGTGGTSTGTFTVALSAPSGRPVTVLYATGDGSATSPDDYASASGMVSLAPGETAKPVQVVVDGDTADEVDETFNVTLSSPTNATIADAIGVGTITDDDGPPALSVSNVSVAEGNSGTVDTNFTVTLLPASGKTVTVNYATSNGSAAAPADYTAKSGTLTFTPGQTSLPVTVLAKGDTLDEDDEIFTLDLWGPSNATIFDGQGVGTITDDEAVPAITVGNATVSEGDSGTQNAAFTVTLSPASGRTVTVNYGTINGTAFAPGDYTATSGTLTFAAGETTKDVNVPVVGELDTELTETFTLNLTAPSNATVADGSGDGTITDSDPDPTVSVHDVTHNEGNAGPTNAAFTVELSASSYKTVTVDYTTVPGSAVVPNDYLAASGTVTFVPGDTSETVIVQVAGDTLDELDETFELALSNPVNTSVVGGTGAATIVDDDAEPSLSVDNVGVSEGDAGTTDAEFTVSLSAASGRTVTVDYGTLGGAATAPDDFASTSGTLTFTPGQVTKTVTVTVKGDVLDEGNETYSLDLSTPSNATIADGQGTGTITDDDPVPTVGVGDATVTEGNTGTKDATFTVTLSVSSGRPVSVNYATADGTAIAPGDYTAMSGTLTFAAGETSKDVKVPVVGELSAEHTESFSLNLTAPSNASIADNQGIGTVTDNDPDPPVGIDSVSVPEGDAGPSQATFTVSLAGSSVKTVSVNYVTVDDSAVEPGDFTATSGTLTFTPGQTAKTVTVDVVGDTLDEDDETFEVSLSNPVNTTVAGGSGIGTIDDDDAAPTLSIDDVAVVEGDSGTTPAEFTVSLSSASGKTVSIEYETVEDSAVAPADLAAGSGTLTFNPGQLTKTVTVAVKGDAVNEIDETYAVDLSDPSNGTVADGNGVGTITDDDPLPDVSVADTSVTEGDAGTDDATFTVQLSAPSGRSVAVDYATADGTATEPDDYAATNGTLTFAPGETTKDVDVPVSGDTAAEPDETLVLSLSGPVNVNIVGGPAEGTIDDNDPDPSVSIGDQSVAEADTGATSTATFTVSLSASSFKTITVDYATADGTAVAPDDYTVTNGTLTFVSGETTKTVAVEVVGDMTDEPDETFMVELSDPSNASVAGGDGTGTIADNDKIPTSIVSASATKTKAKVIGGATVLNAEVGMTVTIKMQRKKGSKYVRGISRTVVVRTVTDADNDFVIEGRIAKKFKKPARGAYRFVFSFAGDATHLPSSATKKFKV